MGAPRTCAHHFGRAGHMNAKDSSRHYCTEHVRDQNTCQGRRRPCQHCEQLRFEAQAHQLRQVRARQVPL